MAPRKMPQNSKYSPATRERAVRLVLEQGEKYRHEYQAIRAIAEQFGMHPKTLKNWVHQARVEAGEVSASPDTRDLEIAELKRENAELAQTVEILKAATTFFARECDPLPPLSAGSSPSTRTSSESHRSAES
jgi:transposase